MVIKPIAGQFQSIKILRKWHPVPSFKGAGAAVKDYSPLTLGATPEVESVAGARDLLKVIRASSGVKKNQTGVGLPLKKLIKIVIHFALHAT